MSKISGQLLISGQFQYICDISQISGISGQLGALLNFNIAKSKDRPTWYGTNMCLGVH